LARAGRLRNRRTATPRGVLRTAMSLSWSLSRSTSIRSREFCAH
jgi:hypothetical protein